jgi:NAD(P)-dependent dehydrogenase (short-subunit alcohol dehydrogenase family)
VDVLLNNAGVLGSGTGQSIGQLDPDEFHRVMAVNALGPL